MNANEIDTFMGLLHDLCGVSALSTDWCVGLLTIKDGARKELKATVEHAIKTQRDILMPMQPLTEEHWFLCKIQHTGTVSVYNSLNETRGSVTTMRALMNFLTSNVDLGGNRQWMEAEVPVTNKQIFTTVGSTPF